VKRPYILLVFPEYFITLSAKNKQKSDNCNDMSKIAGYILILNSNRYSSFRNNSYNEFSEPVPEFKYSRNRPLICFITNQSGIITHIGFGARGLRAGTDLSKLNIEDIFELNTAVSVMEIARLSVPKVKLNLIDIATNGGLLSAASFEEFLRIFLEKVPETISILGRYTKERRLRIEKISISEKQSLAEQKEAVLTAMNIVGIDRDDAQGWDYDDKSKPSSYLDGLPQVTQREDSVIINDSLNIPGFELIKSTKYSSFLFQNENTRLTLLLTNRQPLEELMGTDLIYFNEDFKCFVLVQYKMMEKESDIYRFRLPNKQLSEEIFRMKSIHNSIKDIIGNGVVNDSRISEEPFFIKICPRLEFDLDNTALSSGMYIPLDYIRMLENDKCIEGKNGGKSITFDSVGRYFDNTAFKTIIEGGWIGTNQNQSLLIEKMIKDILENGKTAVIAIKKRIGLTNQLKNRSKRRS